MSFESRAIGNDQQSRYVVTGPGVAEATVREPTTFTINTLDQNGNALQTDGGELFFVAIRGVSQVRARITDNEDGTYTVIWQPPISGRYSIAVSNFGIPLAGSPFFVTASTPQPCHSQCILRGEALTSGIARETNSFNIAFKDKLGIVTRAVELDVFVEPVPTGSPRAYTSKVSKALAAKQRSLPDPAIEDSASPSKERSDASESFTASAPANAPASTENSMALDEEAVRTGDMTGEQTFRTRHRKIRIKVHGKPLVVRSGPNLESEQLGFLMPGAIVTVIEERISPDGVRACVALDFLSKSEGMKSERASTSQRSSCSTFRAVGTGRSFLTNIATPRLGNAHELSSLPDPSSGNGFWSGTSRLRKATLHGSGSRSRRNGPARRLSHSTESPRGDGTRASWDANDTSTCGMLAQQTEQITHRAASQTMLDKYKSMDGRVQQHLGYDLPLDLGLAPFTGPEQQLPSTSSGRQRPSHGAHVAEDSICIDETANDYREFEVGWVTLVKSGKKLVTSRIRLDPERRRHYLQQWERRMVTDKLANDSSNADKLDYKNAAAKAAALTFKSSLVTRSFTMERSSAAGDDPAAFAFGGVYPGTVHAHGKLQEWHRVSYSIGIAGQYLLHVRLRKQATSLPGSPYLLNIKPGRAYALSTRLPKEIAGEVGGGCELVLVTGDKMGNPCITGGGAITFECESPHIGAEYTDQEDGSYVVKWTSKRTGVFQVSVKIDGMHALNSPTTVKLVSTVPDVSKCEAIGDGLKQIFKGDKGVFEIQFFDMYSNPTVLTPKFRASFQAGMCMIAPGQGLGNKPKYEFEGEWIENNTESGYASYRMTFVPISAGAFALHVWWERDGQRIPLSMSPFNLSVHTNANDQVVSHEVVDASGILSGDYKVHRSVFDEVQRMWGPCTIDAFASAATSLLPRFWTQATVIGADGTDAFKQLWKRSDRIWAHPPPAALPQLAKRLAQKEREAEFIVCTPFRPSADWFFKISSLSDDQQKFMAGKLISVAKDAPARLEEWPIMLFHVPGQGSGPGPIPPRKKGAREERNQEHNLSA